MAASRQDYTAAFEQLSQTVTKAKNLESSRGIGGGDKQLETCGRKIVASQPVKTG
jgi:hypothetical protein